MEEAWTKLKRNCCLGKAFESAVFESKEAAGMDESVIHEYMQEVIDVCREKRKRKKERKNPILNGRRKSLPSLRRNTFS